MRKIIGFPHPPLAVGGPSSFQERLTKQLRDRGYRIVYPDDNIWPDVVFILAGTTKLLWVLRCKLRGAQIIHRLDSLHWQFRYSDHPRLYKIRARIRNLIMTYIRRYLATHAVYQSGFVKRWWESEKGEVRIPSCVIYNGVDLAEFCNLSRRHKKKYGEIVILCAESRLERDKVSAEVIQHVSTVLAKTGNDFKIKIVGLLDSYDQAWLSKIPGVVIGPFIPRDKMAEQYQNADLLLSLDINAACPNTVIEALACGLPVIGYQTGALPELVSREAGVLAEYGSDPWRRETPDLVAIEDAMREVLANLDCFREGARRTALELFEISSMTEKYLRVIEKTG